MSGGSWDYVCFRIDEAAERLKRERCPYRRALGEKMLLIGKAMHDIEWVDSCDYGPGEELEAIKTALGNDAQGLALGQLLKDAEVLIAELRSFTETKEDHEQR